VKPWLLVESRKHRIARHPDGPWGMYCPERGADRMIYALNGYAMLQALAMGTRCPHSEIVGEDPDALT
jgi:hypothetical protein